MAIRTALQVGAVTQGHGLIVLADDYGEPVLQITSATDVGRVVPGNIPVANTRAVIQTSRGTVVMRTGQQLERRPAISISCDGFVGTRWSSVRRRRCCVDPDRFRYAIG